MTATWSVRTPRQGPLVPVELTPLAAGGCHAWGLNGYGNTGLIQPTTGFALPTIDVWNDAYGLNPVDGILPGPAVWVIAGTIDLTFNLAPTSGEIIVGLGLDTVQENAEPADAGGAVRGNVIPRSSTVASVHFTGSVLSTEPWVPTLYVANTTNRPVINGDITFHAFGSCPAEHGTTGASA